MYRKESIDTEKAKNHPSLIETQQSAGSAEQGSAGRAGPMWDSRAAYFTRI